MSAAAVAPSPAAAADDTLLADTGWQALILHDLRAPLTVVVGEVQLLRRRLDRLEPHTMDEHEVMRRLDRIARATDRMVGMLDELQALARRRPAPLLRQRIDLVELAHVVATEYAERLAEPGIAVLAADAALVGRWDAARLERAVGNLVGNAVKYSPHGGEIVLAIWRERRTSGEWAAIAVRDKGVGIPANDLAHVFERFYRGRNVIGHFDGAGLGLASVLQIVEQHGGTISVESREGRGTTFTVRLPLALDA
jgi:signal transduction histidine kinase